MTFPLEKILTISAGDYCESVGKSIRDYQVVGVHIVGFEQALWSKSGNSLTGFKVQKGFLESIPNNAEVIIGYFHSLGGANTGAIYAYACGTALIPKENTSK